MPQVDHYRSTLKREDKFLSFPYEKRFILYLRNERFLEENTIADLTRDITRFFNYLRQNNPNYRDSLKVSSISSNDIKEYLNTLSITNNIKNTTYNKMLTHINTYFKFLFINNLSPVLPTLSIKGRKRTVNKTNDLAWTEKLAEYLVDDNLSLYTRMTLLLISHFYTIKEILQKDFYQELNQIEFTNFEYEFINLFNEEILNLQQRQHTHDIFLKKRLDIVSPQLTLPGLHKYLKKDQKNIDIKLSPRELYQNVVCYFILNNQNLSDTQLIQRLRLEDLTSLNYYRQKSSSTTE